MWPFRKEHAKDEQIAKTEKERDEARKKLEDVQKRLTDAITPLLRQVED